MKTEYCKLPTRILRKRREYANFSQVLIYLNYSLFDALKEAILFCSGRWFCPCFPFHFYINPLNVLDQYIIIY